MKRFTDAGRRAVADENWYAALTTALIIPDICASIEDPGPGKSQARYERWCEKWVEPHFAKAFGGEHRNELRAEDVYQARCSVIHSGTAEIEPKRRRSFEKFEFFSGGGAHLTFVTGETFNGEAQRPYLQMRVDMFSETIFQAADDWDAAIADDPGLQAEKAKLLVIHAPGTSIGSITFGGR